jgi:predicted small secreted protein
MRMMIRAVILAAAASVFLSACETIKGVGRDIESTGEAIDDAVDE